MSHNRGYALIETLLGTIILASGLVSVASLFSVSTTVNIRNRQLTAAALLVYDKMEQLHTDGLSAGGALDPSHPVTGFMEYVHVAADGTVIVDNINSPAAYLRLWEVDTSAPSTVTVAVYAGIGRAAPLELARATSSW
jgi:type II secretory pathway pseudopilin PulG